MKHHALLILAMTTLPACDTFRTRITEFGFPTEMEAPQRFTRVADAAERIASAHGLSRRACPSSVGEPCRAFDGPAYLEVYPAGNRVRVRLLETSAISPADSIERELSARLMERYGAKEVEIVRVQ